MEFINSPYAQPREQTHMQRRDVNQSMKILRNDLLSEGREVHTADCYRTKMGFDT